MGVVHAGIGQALMQQGVHDRDEVTDLPEEFAERNLCEEAPVTDCLHKLAGAGKSKKGVGAGAGVNSFIVERPERVYIAVNKSIESTHKSRHQFLALATIHLEGFRVTFLGEFFLMLL